MTTSNFNYKVFIFYSIFFSITLKFIYVILCEYYNQAFFVGPDAYGLFFGSLDYAYERSLTTSESPLTYFIFFLGKFYYYTFENYIWACFVSICIWFISYMLFYKSMILLQFSKLNILYATLIFSFLPSITLVTSTTLREVWQLLCVNLLLYLFVYLFTFNKKKILIFLSIIIVSIFLFILHRSLIFIGPFTFFLIFSNLVNFNFRKIYIPGILIFTFILLIYPYYIFTEFYIVGGFTQLEKGLPLAIEQYQRGVVLSAPNARGNYVTLESIHIKNYLDLLIFLPIAFLKYLFEPLISFTKISSIKDLVAVFENILKLFLFILFFVRGNYKNYIIRGLFLLYIFIELIWSTGTTNWGTALRHHVPSWGLLIVCCLYNGYYVKKYD